MPMKALIWIIAGLVYLLWPYDVIPDFIVLVGWVDDILIALLALTMAVQSLKKKLKPPRRPPDIKEDDVIDVEVEKD